MEFKPYPTFTGKPVECARCGDKIWSKYDGQFVSCKCKAISVDQTPYYTRYIGNAEDFVKEKPE